MPGIFDMFSSPSMQGIGGGRSPGGIFGGVDALEPAKPNTWDMISMVASGLQDANAAYRGDKGGYLDANLADAQTQKLQHARKALMGALQSEDPAVRQKAYAFLSISGGNPKPFQDQQATAALPKLLQSMQPKQDTVSAMPAPLPMGPQFAPQTMDYQRPGMGFSDALAASDSPELQGQYAPELIKDLMKGPDNTPHEGVNPTTGKPGQYVMNRGTPQWLDVGVQAKAPTTRTVRMGGQEVTQEFDPATGWKEVGRGAAWKPDAAAPGLPGMNGSAKPLASYPPETQAVVKAMLEGRQAPPTSFALSKPYWQNLMALANASDPSFDQTTWGSRASARKDMLGGGNSYKLLNAGNTAIQHLGRLHDQIGDVAGHKIPLIGNFLNSAENATAQASGVPGVNAYNDTLGHLAEETTKFYRGTGGAEADVARNMSNLSANLSGEQKESGTANTVHLIYGKLAPMVEQYNKTMGTSYPTSHFLSKEAVKTIQKMGFDADSGEATEKPKKPPPGPAAALPRLPSSNSGWTVKRR